MFLFDIDERHRLLVLRAMRTVALADGEETAKELALLDVARDALGLGGATELAPLDASDPALAELTPRDRERIIHHHGRWFLRAQFA